MSLRKQNRHVCIELLSDAGNCNAAIVSGYGSCNVRESSYEI
jgi:hypothetical protein